MDCHTLPKVLQKGFAFDRNPNSGKYKIRVMDLELHGGGWRNTDTVFYTRDFYDAELEDKLDSSLENKIDDMVGALISAIESCDPKRKVIELYRGDVDFMRKLLLIQMIRTPQAMEETIEMLNDDLLHGVRMFSQDIIEGETAEDLWCRALRTAVDSEWKDMGHTGIMFLDNLVSVINCMSPVVFRTGTDLLLPDSGYFVESVQIVDKGRHYSEEDIKRAYGRRLTDVQMGRIMSGEATYVNYFGIPMARNVAFLFVDDYWNVHRRAKESHIPVKDMIDSRLSGCLVGSVVRYATPGVEWKMVHSHDAESPHSRDDVFEVPIRDVPGYVTNEINLKSLDNTERVVAFHDIVSVKRSLDHYSSVGGKHDVSFYTEVDFDKDYPMDMSKHNGVKRGKSSPAP